MRPPCPFPIDRLVDCARDAAAAGHGKASAVYERYAQELGIARVTLLRHLKAQGVGKPRKQRATAGSTQLQQVEAEAIVRWQLENARKNGSKRMVTLQDAVDTLRANGVIRAESVNPGTGEVTPLTLSTIRRAIEAFGLSAKVLHARAPSIEVAALHPNHVWQVDASICTLFYLPKDGGLQQMKAEVFEKNKPGNFAKVEQARVWRYVVVDKASHAIYVEYVFGGESSLNVIQVLINAMQQRSNEVLFGVPKVIYCDPASSHRSANMKRFCAALGITLEWHLPGNARATGSVEKAQDLVEQHFESMLASRRVLSIDELNAFAKQWRVKFNAVARHSRHKMTRQACWLTIERDQLVQAPGQEVCMQLATTEPKVCTITQGLSIRFKGAEYEIDQATFPGAYVGQKVMVTRNAFTEEYVNFVDAAMQHSDAPAYVAKKVQRNELGYRLDAPVHGEAFSSYKRTAAQQVLERFAEQKEADNATSQPGQKPARAMPFGGKVDPFKHMAEAPSLDFVPRAFGEVRQVIGLVAETADLSVTEACAAIRSIVTGMGQEYDTSTYMRLKSEYPDGRVPQSVVDAYAMPEKVAPMADGTHGGKATLQRVK